jgi:hypothetical protein
VECDFPIPVIVLDVVALVIRSDVCPRRRSDAGTAREEEEEARRRLVVVAGHVIIRPAADGLAENMARRAAGGVAVDSIIIVISLVRPRLALYSSMIFLDRFGFMLLLLLSLFFSRRGRQLLFPSRGSVTIEPSRACLLHDV